MRRLSLVALFLVSTSTALAVPGASAEAPTTPPPAGDALAVGVGAPPIPEGVPLIDPTVAPGAAPAAATGLDAERLDAVERKLDRLDRLGRQHRAELARLDAEEQALRASTVLRGRAWVRLMRAGLLPVSGGLDALANHAARVERLERAVARDLAARERLGARRRALRLELARVDEARTPLELQQRALHQARTALLEAQDRDLAFRRAFQGSEDHTAVYGATGPLDPIEAASGFAALEGKLPLPIGGRVEARSASRAGSVAPGIELIAPLGTAVRAVFGGRVAFADVYADYGTTVIVDHGGGWFTVSANLHELAVATGDEVTSGTRLGSVGAAPEGVGGALYFEIRSGTDSVNARRWLGL